MVSGAMREGTRKPTAEYGNLATAVEELDTYNVTVTPRFLGCGAGVAASESLPHETEIDQPISENGVHGVSAFGESHPGRRRRVVEGTVALPCHVADGVEKQEMRPVLC